MPLISGGGGGGGGGFTPVACVLLLGTAVDVSGAGSHPMLWDGLEDDVWNENPLSEIPAGLGLSFAFDGSDSTITTTVAGTWAFSITLLGAGTDLDWRGHYDDNLVAQSRIVQQTAADGGQVQSLTVCDVMTLPVGAQIAPGIVTDAAAGASQTFTATCMVTRLG